MTPNEKKELVVNVSPAKGAFVDFGEGWVPVPEDGKAARAIDHDITVRVKNECCVPQEAIAKYGQSELTIELPFRPGTIIPHCKLPDVSVRIDNKLATLDQKTSVFLENVFPEKTVQVEWFTSTKSWRVPVKISAGKTEDVTCDPPR